MGAPSENNTALIQFLAPPAMRRGAAARAAAADISMAQWMRRIVAAALEATNGTSSRPRPRRRTRR